MTLFVENTRKPDEYWMVAPRNETIFPTFEQAADQQFPPLLLISPLQSARRVLFVTVAIRENNPFS
jgi:hypothetical protein